MKRTIVSLIVAVVLFAAPAQGRQVTVTGTAPVLDNAGTCTTPSYEPMPVNNPLKVIFEWRQGTILVLPIDTLSTTAGTAFTRTYNLNPGTYTLFNRVQDAGGVSCDTSIVVILPKGAPHKVTNLRKP